MRHLHVSRTIEAPAADAWELLVDTRRWPVWGPTVRGAELDDGGHRIGSGTTGRVRTVAGPTVPFEVTDWQEGRTWGWEVASLPATTHHVTEIGPGRCEVAFGVPWVAAPYLAVCRWALARIAAELESRAR